MNNNTETGLPENVHLLEALDTLFDELNLSFQWRKPSCMMAVYNSSPIQLQAMTILATNLLSAGYNIVPVNASEIKTDEFEATFAEDPDDARVYFIENITSAMEVSELKNWRAFIYERDNPSQQPARLVFWLNESELIDLVQTFPDFWENRYRVIDITDECVDQFECDLQQKHARFTSHSSLSGLASADESLAARFEREAREYLKDGILEFQQADYYNACQYLQNAADLADIVQDSQLQVECQQALALNFAKMKDYDLAIEAYQKIIKVSAPNGTILNNLGNLHLQLNDMPKALEAFQQAIDLDRTDPVSWEGVARVYYKYGLTEKAIGSYRKAIDLVPDFVDAWEGLGNIFLEQEKLDLAVKAYQKVLSKDTARTSTWIHFAQIYSSRKKYAEAVSIFRKALEFQPTEIRLWLELGDLHLSCVDGQAAIDAFTKALVISPRHGPAYCKLADAQKMTGNIPIAISCYELGIDFSDDDDPQRSTSMQNLLALQSQQHISMAASLSDDSGDTVFESAFIDDRQELVDITTDSFVITPVDVDQPGVPVHDATYWNNLGNAHFAEGNYDRAIQAYQAAIESSPEGYWPYVQNMATAYMHKGNMGYEAPQDTDDMFVDVPVSIPQEVVTESEQSVQMNNQQQPDQHTPTISSTPNVYAGIDLQGRSEKLQSSERRARHLDLDRVEGLGPKAAGSRHACPRPIRNKKEWDLYVKFADPILSSWTESERHKLLLDAILEQPRAELVQSSQASENRLLQAGTQLRFAADANYEKSKLGSAKRSMINGPVHAPGIENEKWPQAWIHQGNFLTKKGDYVNAAASFSMAISLDPNLGSAYTSLGLVYFHQEKYKDARSQFLKSIELLEDAKEKSASWNYLGDTYRRLHDETHALLAYEKAIELNNNNNPLKWRARNLMLSNCR